MKDFFLNVSSFEEKSTSARKGISDVAELRKLDVPGDGASFMVKKTLYVFVAGDATGDDGIFSVRPNGIPAGKPGRYRLPTLSPRNKS